jgi:hypothetical protein
MTGQGQIKDTTKRLSQCAFLYIKKNKVVKINRDNCRILGNRARNN